MHYLLGLAALVLGAIIATRRTRPTWFVVTTCVLVGVGALLAILSYTRVTDPMGLLANSIIGWVFVGLSIITMFGAIFVLERRGEHGEELPPLIGDNPLDGDTDDSDDPVQGRGSLAGAESVLGGAAAAGAAGSIAAGSAGYAGVGAAGAEAFATEAAGAPVHEQPPAETDPDYDAWQAAGEPGPSARAVDGTTVIGADPDLATDPAETDVEAAPEGGAGGEGTGDHTTDDQRGTERP